MRKLALLALCGSAIVLPSSLFAGIIPYPNPGTIAPTVLTYASSSGGVNIYFAGSGASFTDYIEVYVAPVLPGLM